MNILLNYFRKRPKLYSFFKKLYGVTFGFYWLKRSYLKIFGLFNGKKRIKLEEGKIADRIVLEKILSKQSFMLARYGSTEFRNLVGDKDFDLLCFYSGFFPRDRRLLQRFRKLYFKGSKQIDFLVMWNYQNHFIKKLKFLSNFSNINHIFSELPLLNAQWTKALENKKVLVIHPFKKTIEMQNKKRKQIGILPKFRKLEIIKAVQTLANTKDERFNDWFEALDYMKKEIDKKDFDIALIGCGAYGLPLAAYIKSKGKQAMHIGGALQLLFGIKGKRWETLFNISMNKYWIRPLEQDQLKQGSKIEGGCYW